MQPPTQPIRPRYPHAIPRVAILVDTSTTWGRAIVAGVTSYTRTHKRWQIFVEARGLEEHLQLPPRWNCDGVIARISTPRMAGELRTKKIPVVNVSSIEIAGANYPRVNTNLEASAQLAVDHFKERGFRHFAYFRMEGVGYVSTYQEAFTRRVVDSGGDISIFTAKPQAGAEPDWRLDLKKLGAWLKILSKPVAILCWNASGAREIIFACQQVGLQVPEEVAVLSQSYDEVMCEATEIPISGVRAAADTIGFQAAKLLDELMRGKKSPKTPHLIAPLSIVARQSTDTLAVRDPALVKALSYIRQQATLPVRVNEVARHAGVSRRALERKFLEILQRTPAEELRRYQLDRARQLIADTNLPMPEIAEKSGFGSQAYLSAIFRKHFEKTPLKFRRESQQR